MYTFQPTKQTAAHHACAAAPSAPAPSSGPEVRCRLAAAERADKTSYICGSVQRPPAAAYGGAARCASSAAMAVPTVAVGSMARSSACMRSTSSTAAEAPRAHFWLGAPAPAARRQPQQLERGRWLTHHAMKPANRAKRHGGGERRASEEDVRRAAAQRKARTHRPRSRRASCRETRARDAAPETPQRLGSASFVCQ
jgi:hypothetical protein